MESGCCGSMGSGSRRRLSWSRTRSLIQKFSTETDYQQVNEDKELGNDVNAEHHPIATSLCCLDSHYRRW